MAAKNRGTGWIKLMLVLSLPLGVAASAPTQHVPELRRQSAAKSGFPVLFIHGAATPAFGLGHPDDTCGGHAHLGPWAALRAGDNGCEWQPLRTYLESRTIDGQPVSVTTVGYFYNDSNMDAYLDTHGDPRLCYGRDFYGAGNDGEQRAADGRPSHNANADLRHLGYQLAWFIHDDYGDRPVGIVADSMGGVLVRAMLYGAAGGRYGTGDIDPTCTYPAGMRVNNVVTLSSPLSGAAIAAPACTAHLAREFCQLVGHDRRNDFLWTLDHSSTGISSTRWTLIGSVSDPIVSASSATDIGPGSAGVQKVVFLSASSRCHIDTHNRCAYAHGALKQDTRAGQDAVATRSGTTANRAAAASHPGAWIYSGLGG